MESPVLRADDACAASPRPLLSLCMIARDEEGDLPRCLASVAGVVDDIVLVDTGSTDRTSDIAAAHGARVVRHAWNDDFSTARNAALEHARGRWILVLDADEELDSAEPSLLRRVVQAPPWDGARVRIRNLQPPGDLFQAQAFRATRLFRNRPMYRYAGIVHEQIAPAILHAGGTVGDADLTIIHHGYVRRTAQAGVDRTARNLRLLERALALTPDDPYLHYQFGATLKMAGATAQAHRALQRALSASVGELHPEVEELAHMKLAQLALADGRLAEAVVHARASLAVRSDNVVSLLTLGLALLFSGDAAGAYATLLQARTLGGGDLQAAQLDAILTYCQQHFSDALPATSHGPLPKS